MSGTEPVDLESLRGMHGEPERAADLIDRLEAENKRFREALYRVANVNLGGDHAVEVAYDALTYGQPNHQSHYPGCSCWAEKENS